jgi:broad specificity phosphatase PhoE
MNHLWGQNKCWNSKAVKVILAYLRGLNDEIGTDTMEKFNACDESVTPDGGESFPALKNRVLQARGTTLELKEPGRASAVVSHLQVTRSLLSDALGVSTNNMALLKVATASVTYMVYCTATGS